MADVEVGVHSPNALSVMTTYSDTLGATGVLVSLQFLTSSGDLVISRSRLLVLDRSSSSNHTITDLFPGRYRVLVYDVEQDQKVSSGLGFPAVSIEEVNVTGDNQGTHYTFAMVALTCTCTICSVDHWPRVRILRGLQH